MFKPALQRYKKIDGQHTIEIRVSNPLQLFDSRDPAPFRDRDLDDDFTEYIIASAEEIPQTVPLLIKIYIANATSDIKSEFISEAIKSWFEYQIDLKKIQFGKLLGMARFFLSIGLIILAVCLSLAHLIQVSEGELFSTVLREGIVIFGWVSLWKPLELLLFDWYPLYDRIRLFRRILTAKIEVELEASGS